MVDGKDVRAVNLCVLYYDVIDQVMPEVNSVLSHMKQFSEVIFSVIIEE